MPRRKSSLKKSRSDKKKHLKNLRVKIDLKKAVKKFRALLAEKNIEEAKKNLQKVYAKLDKAAKKKIIHPNNASRKKSRLALSLKKTAKSA